MCRKLALGGSCAACDELLTISDLVGFADRLRRGRAPTSDLGVRNTVRGPQQRLGLPHLPSRRSVRTSKPLQLSPLSTRHLQSPSRSHDPTHTAIDHYLSDTSPVYPSAVLLRNATPSVLYQRHIGRVLRSSCNPRGRRLASSRGREPQPGRCPSLWPGDLRNDGISMAAAGADGSET